MATNNFKPFSIGAGANVISQADYEALSALLTGFQSGKASSSQINKALRQSSVMAYVLAQYISDIGAVDVLDNGTPATILANLKSAIQSVSKATAIPLMTGVVGQTRNLVMSVTAAAASATITADEIIVATALGGSQYRIGNFSKTINLSTTGAGGMDTGTVPATGFVAIYAIYNPTTGASALLAVNATSAIAPEVYGGANMPSGYSASSLLSVWRTSGSQFVPGYQQDRIISIIRTNVLSTSTNTTSSTPLNLSALVPINAKNVDIILTSTQASNGSGVGIIAQSSPSGISYIGNTAVATSGTSASYVSGVLPLIAAQTIYYYMVTTNAGSYVINLGKYSI